MHTASETTPPPRTFLLIAVLLAASTALCVLAYLALGVPGAWLSSASEMVWSGRDLGVPRGNALLQRGSLVVLAPDASGVALVSVTTTFRSSKFPVIAWDADVPRGVDVTLLWSTDYNPQRVFNRQLPVIAGHISPEVMMGDPNWLGNITAIGVLLRGKFPAPVIVRAVAARPVTAVQTLRDRFDEWFAFEPWRSGSINQLLGGAPVQKLPLPGLVATIVALAMLAYAALTHLSKGRVGLYRPVVIAAFLLAGWFVLDARWTWNLVRQVAVAWTQYAGKSWHERHLATEDAVLFAFIGKVRGVLPPLPSTARLFMAADSGYFRGRGAYHLYPYNVYADVKHNTLPPPSALHPGDYLVVFQRPGIEFNASERRLRWDGGTPVPAEPVFVESGNALFRVL